MTLYYDRLKHQPNIENIPTEFVLSLPLRSENSFSVRFRKGGNPKGVKYKIGIFVFLSLDLRPLLVSKNLASVTEVIPFRDEIISDIFWTYFLLLFRCDQALNYEAPTGWCDHNLARE